MTEIVARSRPEEQLPGLLVALLELRSAMWASGTKPALDDELAALIKNIAVTSQLSQHPLYAIAGLQGTGKTTLLREAYDLDGTWLRPNAGRGETLPILVIESHSITSVAEVTGWLWTLGSSKASAGKVERIQAESADAWWREVRSAGTTVLCAEITVPAGVFELDGAGFVLLPGFEGDDDPDSDFDYDWRTLMRQSLIASAGAIVVVNAGTLATGQDELLDDLRGIYGSAISPIVAISHTEHLRDEVERDQLRDRACEVFKVDQSQVILTGEGPSYRGEWLERFREMVASEGAGVSGMRSMQLESMARLLHRQLMPLLERVRIEEYQGTQLNEGAEKFRKWMDLLEESTQEARKDYETKLQGIASDQLTQATKALNESTDAKSGFETQMDALGAWAKMQSDRHSRDRDAFAVQIWNEASLSHDGFKTSLSSALEALENSALNRAIALSKDGGPADKGNPFTPNDSTSMPLGGLEVPDEVLADACFLSGHGSLTLTAADGTRRILSTESHSEHFAESIRCLPAMVFGALSVATRTSQIRLHDGEITLEREGGEELAELLSSLTANRRAILKGALLFIGADLLADGEIDSIPALAHGVQTLLFGAPSVAAGAATTAAAVSTAVVSTVMGAVIVGAAAAAVIQYGNSANEKGYARALAVINAASTRTVASELDNFDEFMRFVTQRVAARLNGYLELDHTEVQLLTLQRALAQVQVNTARALMALG